MCRCLLRFKGSESPETVHKQHDSSSNSIVVLDVPTTIIVIVYPLTATVPLTLPRVLLAYIAGKRNDQ